MFSISCSSIGLALLIFLVVMCAISEAAQYRAKFVIFTLFCAFAASWSIPIMLFRPGDWRNALYNFKLINIKFIFIVNY